METEKVPISSLECDPKNARKHGKRNLDAIKRSLERFGQQKPIVVNAVGRVVAGNGTLEAARSLGWDEIDIVRTELKDGEAKAFAIADNRTAELAEWDEPNLAEILADLQNNQDIDELVTGFNAREIQASIDSMLGKSVEEDEIPEVPEIPITKRGDLWLMGDHRLLCGDSTKAEDVAKVMNGSNADACITDPPYGIGVDYGTFNDSIDNVKLLIHKVMPIILKIPCSAITPGIPCLWYYPKPSWIGAWVHPAPNGSCPWGFCGTNLILYYGTDPYLKNGLGRRPDSIVLAADRESIGGHPTPKPLKVWTWLIKRLTTGKGQLIFDPFSGSGTTFISSDQLGRICFGLEIEPRYCDVTVKRWENLTGKKATRG